uniref:hypothetical protein n=1 Tax=uncultured Acinetobacter sp. TaxID=165433 RepID=UPI00261AE9D5|nr:hypothetical protein [uncultured Acinetobacter sp.]
MNFSTQADLDMSIQITGRDQMTGEDIAKLNALFAAVEGLGGVIEYPPAVDTHGWTLTNATLVNNTLTYTGGTLSNGQAGLTAEYAYEDLMPLLAFDPQNLTADQITLSLNDGTGNLDNSLSIVVADGYIRIYDGQVQQQEVELATLTGLVKLSIEPTSRPELKVYNDAAGIVASYYPSESPTWVRSQFAVGIMMPTMTSTFEATLTIGEYGQY